MDSLVFSLASIIISEESNASQFKTTKGSLEKIINGFWDAALTGGEDGLHYLFLSASTTSISSSNSLNCESGPGRLS